MTMQIDHVGLSVGDLDAQVAWYQGIFDFPTALPFELGAVGLRGVFLCGPNDVAFELLERRGSSHAPTPGHPNEALLTQGWAHVCFRVDDVHGTYDAMIAAGATSLKAPGPAPEPGVTFAFVADPEGNLVELLDRTQSVAEKGGVHRHV
jgi:catechol 2,3-dioxygenase-like lactoylglutathione lyase family enzyme